MEDEELIENLKEQSTSRPWLFKKGQSGNPLGRPPGRSLKDRAKAYLSGLTDEEAVEFFEGMNKKDVWEMAEGKASNILAGENGEPIKFNIINYGNLGSSVPVQTEGLPDRASGSTPEVQDSSSS